MISYGQVMAVTRGVSGSAAFEESECQAYYDLLTNLGSAANVLEIGLQYGRSSSIALQVEREVGFRYFGIDPFVDPPEAWAAWENLWQHLRCPPVTVLQHRTIDVAAFWNLHRQIPRDLDVVLIDGDHTEMGVAIDCTFVIPRMRQSSYLLFHDYGRESLPWVKPTADKILEPMADWRLMGCAGTLGVWRRLV